METNLTQQEMEALVEKLRTELKFRNDSQRWASDGFFVLVETIGSNESLFVLYDENDNEIYRCHE